VSIETVATPTILTSKLIAAIPETPLGSLRHVTHRVLWRHDTSEAGILTVDGGHALGRHAHRVNHHHMWVLDGHATVLGKEVGAGSYVHVPAGVDHDIDATATEGCTVFYLYLAPAP
jgi:mannose-6-phosphate isomerase-like protein (cupin superfamily)